jgi:glycosyltransferase involved in cell wall biosynthesis
LTFDIGLAFVIFSMSLVSVIIPTYNGEAYIKEAIASILAQTYTNYEIIAIDDGSTDNTRNIVKNHLYSDRFTLIAQDNQGVATARNQGLTIAKGEYIAFLDQDDFFYPHKLTEQVSLMEKKPHLGLVNSGWDLVNREGKILSTVQPWQKLPRLNPAAIIVWKPVFLGAMLFRHSWLQKTAGFNPQLEQTPDVELVLSLAAIGCQGDWIEHSTVGYRQHDRNASQNTILQAQELNQVLERFFSQSSITPEIKALEAESRYQSLVWSAWRLYHTGNLREMSYYLAQSVAYINNNKYATEIVLDWIESFTKYAAEYGTKVDLNTLCNSLAWQKLVNQLFITL